MHRLLPHSVSNPSIAARSIDQVVQRFAARGAIDLVIGTHGRTGLSRMLMGSVAEAIVRRAECPVLTYKQPAKKTAVTP